MEQPTNGELLDRIERLEVKMDRMGAMLEQANGAWFFIKLISSIAIGFAVLWNEMHGWFR
jgi:hypothetical protein